MEATFHIVSPGTYRDANGTEFTFTAADLRQMAKDYDPSVREAPIVLGHPTDDEPAYGWVQELWVEEGKLYARAAQLSDRFVDWLEEGRYKKRSASFFLPEQRSPTDGYYLRHIGFLGAMAPAIGGLDPVDLSDEEGVAVFLADGTADLAEGRAAKTLGTVLDRLREWIIETDGRDTADDIIPRWTISSMMEAAGTVGDTEQSGPSLSEDPEDSPAAFASANTLSGALTDAVKAVVDENDDWSRADVVKKMADAAGIEVSTVNGILRGEIEQPPKKRLVGFAQALGIDEQDLLDFLPDDTDTTDMSDSADLTAEELKEREQELDEREKSLREEMREQRREQAAAFAEQLADQGTILPRHKETVTEALFHLEGAEEATVDLSANGGDEEAGVANAFRQMLSDLDPSVPTGEAAPAQGDGAATEEPADFSAPNGTQVREGSKRMELHRKAKQYQRAHDVGYDEALDAVS